MQKKKKQKVRLVLLAGCLIGAPLLAGGVSSTFYLGDTGTGNYYDATNWTNGVIANGGGEMLLAYKGNTQQYGVSNGTITVNGSSTYLTQINGYSVDNSWVNFVMPGGTMNIINASTGFKGKITVNGKGLLKTSTKNKIETTFENAVGETLLPNCVFHVDASDLASLTFEERDGKQVITRWADSYNKTAAIAPDGAQGAVLLPNELNGLPVVDFGAPCDNGGMEWEKSTEVVDVFMVIGSQDGGGTLLGTKQADKDYRLGRGYDLSLLGDIPAAGVFPEDAYVTPYPHTAGLVKERTAFTVIVGADSNIDYREQQARAEQVCLSGGYQLVEIAGPTSVVSAFARRNDLSGAARTGTDGGQRLAEVLAFDTFVGDYNRHLIEAYLLKKWFNITRNSHGPARFENVEVNPEENYMGEQNNLSQAIDAGCGEVVFGNFKVTHKDTEVNPYYSVRASERLVFERADLDRRLRIMGGEVEVTAHQTSATLPVAKPALHLDATTGTETYGNLNTLRRWNDASGGTGYALGAGGIADKEELLPWVVTNPEHFNGKPVVSFRAFQNGAHLELDKQYPVQAYFMVLKVANPATSILGCTMDADRQAYDTWTRYNLQENVIFSSTAVPLVRQSLLWKNGDLMHDPCKVHYDAADEKPGTSFVMIAQNMVSPLMINAFGCGAWQPNNHRAERTGGWELAEVVIYDRPLTNAECMDVQAYLYYKWFGKTLNGYSVPNEPYRIYGVGSGAAGSKITINGIAPVEFATPRFGGQSLEITAPNTFLNFAQGFENNNADNILNSGCLLGAKVPKVTLPDQSQVNVKYANGVSTYMDVNALTVAGGGTFKVFITGDEPVKHFTALKFASADATSRANLATWGTEVIVNGQPAKHEYRLNIVGNEVQLCQQQVPTVIIVR